LTPSDDVPNQCVLQLRNYRVCGWRLICMHFVSLTIFLLFRATFKDQELTWSS